MKNGFRRRRLEAESWNPETVNVQALEIIYLLHVFTLYFLDGLSTVVETLYISHKGIMVMKWPQLVSVTFPEKYIFLYFKVHSSRAWNILASLFHLFARRFTGYARRFGMHIEKIKKNSAPVFRNIFQFRIIFGLMNNHAERGRKSTSTRQNCVSVSLIFSYTVSWAVKVIWKIYHLLETSVWNSYSTVSAHIQVNFCTNAERMRSEEIKVY